MVRPVSRQLPSHHLLLLAILTILNLWPLASCSVVSREEVSTAFRQTFPLKSPAIKVKQGNSEPQQQQHQPVQPSSLTSTTLSGKGQSPNSQRHPPREAEKEKAIHEPSTLSLFHLSKASKCCTLTNEPSCKLSCTRGMSQLKAFEGQCTVRGGTPKEANGKHTCLEEVELLSLKKQFIAGLENECGQPLTVDSSEQLWMCLLKSGYFEQIEEEQQQQHQPSTHANNLIFASDLGEAPTLEFALTKPPPQEQQQHSSAVANGSLNPSKWLCCERARSQSCRQLCYRSLGNEWTDQWAHFTQSCINGAEEGQLRQCLLEGEGRLCVYGCRSGSRSGRLHFCGALFNKPNGLTAAASSAASLVSPGDHHFSYYRDCSVEADQAAAATYRRWLSSSVLYYSHSLALPFRNLSHCRPELWRRLACTVHLKPCRPDRLSSSSTETVCRSNCKLLVDECIDTARAPQQFDSNAFCDMLTNRLGKGNSEDYSSSEGDERLSRNDDTAEDDKTVGGDDEQTESSCIDLTKLIDYKENASSTNDNMSASSETELSTTHNICQGNKCTKEQLCVRNQDCTAENCEPYRCVNACTIGKLRELKVPQETFVNLPAIEAQNVQMIDGTGQRENCHHLCYCNVKGHLVDCKFYCTDQKKSELVQARAEEAALAQIECISACPQEYRPVCDNRTNQNYFNDCISNCALRRRKNQLEKDDQKKNTAHNRKWEAGGECGRMSDLQRTVNIICPNSSDQIDENCTVETGTQLVPLSAELHHISRKVANLADNEKELRKLGLENAAVCDSHGEGHASLRSVRRSFVGSRKKKGKFQNNNNNNVSFAYFGQCLNYCSLFSPVCGRDGTDYQSECSAHAHHLLVDHFGSCHSRSHSEAAAGGQQRRTTTTITCPETRCPAYHFVHYLPLNRCPFCGSVAYFHLAATPLLESITREADRHHVQHLLHRKGQLTVQALSQQLRQLVSVNVCQLYVHQLGGGKGQLLVVLMRATFNINQGVALRQQALCELELGRLVRLVRERSPAVQLLMPLSLLRYSEAVAQRMMVDGSGLQQAPKEKDGAVQSGSGVSTILLMVCCLLYSCLLNRLGGKSE